MATTNPVNPVYEGFYRSLLQVHEELREGARKFGETAGDDARDAQTEALVLSFCDVLLRHHKAEDAFFFPAFRAAGKLKSSDVAVLAALDEEHLTVTRLCGELNDATGARRRGATSGTEWRRHVARLSIELRDVCVPHFATEERILTAEGVATMLTPPQMDAVYRDMKENWTRR